MCMKVDVFTRLYPCRECAEHFGEIVRYEWIPQPDWVCIMAALSLPCWDSGCKQATHEIMACKQLVKSL